ncbi:ATP-binding protein [Cytophagales bacterium LB-30]|uniref:histidine kinase n=1 Tax=Shiella aurantiaca TaxID=3058365 RepID=A0ABT8F5N9_9BACT|nr:ATP-binding protein [Shiella aurantiaca]MDN4165787.1 ATP-binding protein [Shiella aurantiaca]
MIAVTPYTMNFPRAWLILLVCTFLLGPAFAQIPSAGIPPEVTLYHCQVDQWTGENGLVSNNLTSVIQSDEGFLWITTNNGIMRFDGHQLDVFDKLNVPIFATDGFVKSYEHQGKLYFATRGNGIVRYHEGTFEQLLPDEKQLPRSIRSLLFSKSGKLYVGSDTQGVFAIENDTLSRLPGLPEIDAMVMAMAEGADGSLWIATDGKGLYHYRSDGSFKVYTSKSGLLSDALGAVLVLKDGRVLVGTNQGINVIEQGQVGAWSFLRDTRISYLLSDSYGSIWIGAETGLGRVNEQNHTEEFLYNDATFPGSHITSMVFDEEGSLWISTVKSGLLRLKDTNIRNYSTLQGLSLNRVNSIAESKDGSFYIGEDEGHVDLISKQRIGAIDLPGVPNTAIRDIAFDTQGAMWLATYAGLFRKTGNQVEQIKDPAYPANDFRRILFDSKENMWLATKTGGVIQSREGQVQKIWSRNEGLQSNYILAIEEGPNGLIYIGTHSGGLSVLNPDTGEINTYHAIKDDSGVLIFNVHIDENGRVFIVANVGLFYLEDKNIRPIHLDEVSKGESFFDWVEDDYGNVWVSSNIGVVQFLKSDLLDYIKGKRPHVKRRLLDQDYGMRTKECTGATRSYKARDGKIWVPTLDGVCVIDPQKSMENPHIPPVYITQFQTNQGNVLNWEQEQEYSIDPDNLRFSFNFTALSLLAPEKVRFKYKLENFDADWISTEERWAHYTNLPPGEYTFQVIASNNDGVWNLVGDSVRVKVNPHFYQTAQFYVLIFLFTVMVLFAAYQWRVYGIKKKNLELTKVNSELDRFVYSASHDLRAPLASILGLINVARIDDSPENRTEYYNLIEKSVKKLDSFINDIIEFSRNSRLKIHPEPIDFEALINSLIDELRFLDEKNQIRRVVKVSGTGQFCTDQKRLTIVLNNLISNSIKYHNLHGEDPFIELEVKYTEQQAHIVVRDNGTGISKEHLEHIFKMFYRANESSKGSGLGLYIVKEALEKIKGKIRVESEPYKGSTFYIDIKALSVADTEENNSWLSRLRMGLKAMFQ